MVVSLWLQKSIVLLLYRRILFGLPWTDLVMNVYWGILAATYVVIQVVTFTNCRVLYLYWQVMLNPGKKSKHIPNAEKLSADSNFQEPFQKPLVNLQLLAHSTSSPNILLIIHPMPALLEIRRSIPAKLQLFTLFLSASSSSSEQSSASLSTSIIACYKSTEPLGRLSKLSLLHLSRTSLHSIP